VARLDALLVLLHAEGGSDLHLATLQPPRVRIGGALRPIEGQRALSAETLLDMLEEIAGPEAWERFIVNREVELTYWLAGTARFRINCFRQHNGVAAVARLVPEKVCTIADLGLPSALERLTQLSRGLVLIAGPTGSGKTTTLAALVDAINSRDDKHIVTIEDPIELIHTPKVALVSQREVASHTRGFGSALSAALRQNPDVVVVGDIMGRDAAEGAIEAAEAGTLVLGTIRGNSVSRSVDRMVELFAPHEAGFTRDRLASVLAGACAQLLVPTMTDGERIAVHEILLPHPQIAAYVKNPGSLIRLIAENEADGMQTMDSALAAALAAGAIRVADAYRKARDKTRFEAHRATSG
jgi:twitching motility protein PilT